MTSLLASGLILGCGSDEDWLSRRTPPAAHLTPAVETNGESLVGRGAVGAGSTEVPPTRSPTSLTPVDLSAIPVPPADGPPLFPLALAVPIREQPSRQSTPIGTLRVGSRVARSESPVSRDDCLGGWYALHPVGFACAEDDATLDPAHPIVRAVNIEPDRSRAMPYAYGFVRAIAPNYLKVPSRKEQLSYEMHLLRHLGSFAKMKDRWNEHAVGANDVPLHNSGFASGPTPAEPPPRSEGERFGGSGDDAVPWWLTDRRQIPNLSTFKAPEYAVIANRIKRHAGVAMIGSFLATDEGSTRRFAITTDARLIPADKIKPDSGSPFHGVPLKDIELPVAFTRDDSAFTYEFVSRSMKKRDKLRRREFLPLSGRVKMVGGRRFTELRSGQWVESDSLRTIAKPSQLPALAQNQNRWIEVSIVNQTLVLWEGTRPVYATLVSTGRDGLGDPATTLSTPEGTYSIYQKHVTATMDSSVADNEFELRDVPWVMYFKGGYALHAAYWHDDFGRPRSHGCINLSPIDARAVFFWSTPTVPEHIHSVNAGGPFEEGTSILIRP